MTQHDDYETKIHEAFHTIRRECYAKGRADAMAQAASANILLLDANNDLQARIATLEETLEQVAKASPTGLLLDEVSEFIPSWVQPADELQAAIDPGCSSKDIKDHVFQGAVLGDG
jgi:7-keto-8-aminopelargonate synthetase-like enzyme